MTDLSNRCLVGKPVVWQDIAAVALQSPFLTDPALASRQFEREFEQAVWDAARG